MTFFVPLEGSHVLLRRNGTYSEAPIFTYNDILYAKSGSGYARLKPSGNTSVSKLHWEEIDLDPTAGTYAPDTFNLILKPAKRKRVRAVS